MWQNVLKIIGWIFYILSWAISLLIMSSFWLNYGIYNSPIYELDTNYLRWTSTIPAISVCQAGDFNSSSVGIGELNEFLHGIVRPNRSVCNGCKNSNLRNERYHENYSVLVNQMVATCKSLFKRCSWNDKPFDCCQLFGELWTKHGVCYSINSVMTYKNGHTFVVSHFTKRAVLNIAVNFPIQVFLHYSKDVLFVNNDAPAIDKGRSLNLLYYFRETVIDHSASSLAVEQRGCVIAGERTIEGYRTYSESACKTVCTARHQVEHCGCSHHLLPRPEIRGKAKSCGFKGLQCLDTLFKKVQINSLTEYLKACNCLPECEETEIKIVWAKISASNQSEIGVALQLMSPPTERIVLKSKMEFLDVLVGFACFTRLFTSSSILSIAKTILIFIYRCKITRSSKLGLQKLSKHHMDELY